MKQRIKKINSDNATILLTNMVNEFKDAPLTQGIGDKESSLLTGISDAFHIINFRNTSTPSFGAEVEISLDDKKEVIDVIARSDIFLGRLYHRINRVITPDGVNHLVELSNSFLQLENVKPFHKLNVIDAENLNLKAHLDHFISHADREIVFEFIQLRQEILFELIYNFEEIIEGDEKYNQQKEHYYNLLNLYFQYQLDAHIPRKELLQAYNLLVEEISSNEDDAIKKLLINHITNFNSNFLIEPPLRTVERIEEHSDLFSEEELNLLQSIADPDPTAIELSRATVTFGRITEEDIVGHNIISAIHFTLPIRTKTRTSGEIFLDDDTILLYDQIEGFYEDPIYHRLQGLQIGGIGFNYFSDALNLTEIGTTFTIQLDSFYNPDFELQGDHVVPKDFNDESALIGRPYYPQKEFIVRKLLTHLDKLSPELHISREDISVNLFSNFIIDYIKGGQEVIYSRMYSLTNPDSYSKATAQYMERLNDLNVGEAFIHIRNLIDKTRLDSENGLYSFMRSLLDVVVKNNIELHGGFKYFWKDGPAAKPIPKSEPEMQALITFQLKTICEYVGIQISREVESANGEIDFLCTYTSRGRVLKVCVELKNAHSPKVELGLTKQLPQYLNSERTKYGIYLVLWYKGDTFSEPAKYSTPSDLRTHLLAARPKNYNTDVIIINCSKPVVPSKIK